MTGLMMKDALVMRKTLRLYALFLLFYSGLAVLGVFPMSMALAMVEVIVMVLPISSFSYDEAAKWDRYAAVLPVGRTAVVKARYLFLLLVLLALDNLSFVPSMLLTVLRKGAIYALVAVSMNLLNGFTGLFSLGQAGFMLLGAYTYAILTVPVSAKDSVYYLYGGSAVPFSLPDLFLSLIHISEPTRRS